MKSPNISLHQLREIGASFALSGTGVKITLFELLAKKEQNNLKLRKLAGPEHGDRKQVYGFLDNLIQEYGTDKRIQSAEDLICHFCDQIGDSESIKKTIAANMINKLDLLLDHGAIIEPREISYLSHLLKSGHDDYQALLNLVDKAIDKLPLPLDAKSYGLIFHTFIHLTKEDFDFLGGFNRLEKLKTEDNVDGFDNIGNDETMTLFTALNFDERDSFVNKLITWGADPMKAKYDGLDLLSYAIVYKPEKISTLNEIAENLEAYDSVYDDGYNAVTRATNHFIEESSFKHDNSDYIYFRNMYISSLNQLSGYGYDINKTDNSGNNLTSLLDAADKIGEAEKVSLKTDLGLI